VRRLKEKYERKGKKMGSKEGKLSCTKKGSVGNEKKKKLKKNGKQKSWGGSTEHRRAHRGEGRKGVKTQ